MNKSKHRIGVISDTHNMLRPEVIENLKDVEVILHAGDVTSQKVLDGLNEIAEVIAVQGNCDKTLSDVLPHDRLIELYGKKIYLVHDKNTRGTKSDYADIIIFGHSHKYYENKDEGILWLNPGSCGPRRFGNPISMIILTINPEEDSIEVEKIDLNEPQEKTNHVDQKVIDKVYKSLKKGKSVKEILRKNNFDEDLVNQIAQLYFTHPGIDKVGILDKMEIKDK